METFHTYNKYVQVILPLALPKLYTYAVPKQLEAYIQVGIRAEVQFGRQKLYTAIIHSITEQAPIDYAPKEILSVVDEQPIVTPVQLSFWEWLATYYMCTMGDVMQAALPAYFKLDSETYFIKNPNNDFDNLELSDDEYLIAEAFQHQEELTLKDLTAILQRKTISKVIKSLLNKRVMLIKETLQEKYVPKFEVFIEINPAFTKNKLPTKAAFEAVLKSPKQEAALLAYIELSKENKSVKRTELLQKSGSSADVLKALVKKEIFIIKEKIVNRIAEAEIEQLTNYQLTTEQSAALQEIKKITEVKDTVLLHGVTSSGKTFVYAELIKEQIAAGKQVLFLLPEIALTAQLVQRLEKLLGNIAVYHSKFNNAERVEIWNKVLLNEAKIVVGARSAIFLPFQHLGLVVVDEEHDASYKQNDPAPRYQCRDAAIFLAKQHNAKVILGTATPSIESYANAKVGKYGLVKLASRFGDVKMPKIECISLIDAHKKKEITSGITFLLRDEIQSALQKKEQIILFQNRRGYAPYIACANCNWIPQCKNCDVSLTYHKYTNDLRCHYCGYVQSVMLSCAACGSTEMQQRGLGTERIEEDLKLMFPDARIARMDYDTVKSKHGHNKIIDAFEDGAFDILVGTQMVTKGLDFKNVNLVGVLNADALLYYPDFRAIERAYQLLQQVSGRAGRREKQGKVSIQISNVNHQIVDYILGKEYEDFYQAQLQERKLYHYPPYSRLIRLTLKHKEIKTTIEAANKLSEYLHTKYGEWVIGPNAPIIQKINNYYLREILLKIPKEHKELNNVKYTIQQAINGLYQFQSFKQLRVVIDVDCY
ncbi:MAG: primosomal protein N' [Chitinophagales bacterium]